MRLRVIVLSIVLGALAASAASARSNKEEGSYAVEEVPLTQISADLASGRTTSVAVTKAYIVRIKTYNPGLNAVMCIAPDALDQAKASDARRKAGRARGPLEGVPILLKDNIDAVRMPTTAGSFALVENYPAQDSEIARRLRDAGAVILGKTNLDQFAGMRASRTFRGSTVGGMPHNPYALDHSPAGSSSGSGIAAAASLAAAAVGTDTFGSVIDPASVMGLVGLRPTTGLVSRRGIVPISMREDTAGPMARNVTDLATLLTVLAGTDPGDAASRQAHKADYVKGLRADALKGVRLGVVRGVMDYNDRTRILFNTALAVMKRQGATLVEVPVQEFEDLYPEQHMLLLYEFKEDLDAYLAQTPQTVKVRTLEDLIAFSKQDLRESMHDTDSWEQALTLASLGGRDTPGYETTLEHARRFAGPEGLGRAMTEHNVTALIMITLGPADKLVSDGSASPWYSRAVLKGETPIFGGLLAALAGYPVLTVPMGQIGGLPVGISFVGPAWSEQELLGLGYAYEQASQARVPPRAYKATK